MHSGPFETEIITRFDELKLFVYTYDRIGLLFGGIGYAEVAELADARDSKSREGFLLWVRLPPSALRRSQL